MRDKLARETPGQKYAVIRAYFGKELMNKRKLILIGALSLLAPMLLQPGRAQDAPLAQPAEKPISLEQVQSADLIVSGRLATVKNGEGGDEFRFGETNMEILKGARRPWLGRGFWVPTESAVKFASREQAIAFGRWDPIRRQIVILDGDNGKRALSEANLQRVRDLVAQKPRVTLALTSDKTTYAMGEPVTLKWIFQNTSDQAFKLYIGPYAFQYDYIFDNTAHGTSTGGSHTRTEDDYRNLKPGEKFEFTRVLKVAFPEGESRIRMRYANESNWIGSGNSDTKRAAKSLDDVLFLAQETEYPFTVAPPSAAVLQDAIAKLASPLWDEQIAALKIVARTKGGAALPAVRALATHPMPSIRILVADALATEGAPMNPLLRDFLHDPNISVRSAALEFLRKRRIEGGGLAAWALKLAADEAQSKDWLVARTNSDSSAPNTYLVRVPDKRLGDLLLTQMNATGQGARPLEYAADAAREIRLFDDTMPSDEQKQKIAAAWQVARQDVDNAYSVADLEREREHVNERIFLGGKIDARLPQIRELLNKLAGDFDSYGKPEDRTALKELGVAAAPTVLFLLRNGLANNSVAALEFLRESKTPGVLEFLLAQSYPTGDYPRASRFSALQAVLLDQKKALPHIARIFESGDLGAAVAMARAGEKRAVPILMDNIDNFSLPYAEEVYAALGVATGKDFHRAFDWSQWWKDEGKAQTWK